MTTQGSLNCSGSNVPAGDYKGRSAHPLGQQKGGNEGTTRRRRQKEGRGAKAVNRKEDTELQARQALNKDEELKYASSSLMRKHGNMQRSCRLRTIWSARQANNSGSHCKDP